MYLTRTAGIETRGIPNVFSSAMYVSYPHCGNSNFCAWIAQVYSFGFLCILPALRELKRDEVSRIEFVFKHMYLTRTAGIETFSAHARAAFCAQYVSYPHCGNWNVVAPGIMLIGAYVSYPHCGNWNDSKLPLILWPFPYVSYPHCGNWNFTSWINTKT